MEPKEQTFDFTKDTLTENFVKWIIAFAKIPLQHYWGATWLHIAEALGETHGFKRDLNLQTKEPRNDQAVFIETGFCMEEDPVYADNPEEGYSNDASDLFVLKFEPHELYNDETAVDMLITFYRNNKADISYAGTTSEPWYGRYEKYKERMQLPKDGTTMTWQEAYDLLCKIAKDEQNAVPKCNV